MDFYESLQLKAMLACLKPTRESWFGYVMRWYSKTFFTPLHQVQDLPMDEVLLAYYSETFEQMEEAERQDYLERLTQDPEEREKQDEAEEQTEDSMFEQLNQMVEADMKLGRAPESLAPKKKRKERMPGQLKKFEQAPVSKPEPDAEPESIIDMKFDEDSNL